MTAHCEIIRRVDPSVGNQFEYVATQHCADYHQGCNNQVTVWAESKYYLSSVLWPRLRDEGWRFVDGELVCPYCQAWREE